MLREAIFNLGFTITFAFRSIKAKVKFHYPSTLWLKRVVVFKERQVTASQVMHNLLSYSHLYEHVLKHVKSKTPLILEAGFMDGKEQSLRVAVFKSHLRDSMPDVSNNRIVSPTCVDDGRFTFFVINGQLRRCAFNRPGTLERKLGYFEEDPIACFTLPLTDNSFKELSALAEEDRYIHESRFTTPDSFEEETPIYS